MFYFPLVGDGSAGSIRFQTRIVLVNAGAESSVNVGFFDQHGNPASVRLEGRPGRVSSLDLVLERGESFSGLTAGSGNSQGNLFVGYACVTVADSAQVTPAVGGTAIFIRADIPSGQILYTAAVPASRAVTDFTAFLDTIGSKNTGLAMVYPQMLGPGGEAGPTPAGDGPATVTLRVYDKSFRLQGQTEVTLDEGAQTSRFARGEFFPGLGALEGTITGDSDRAIEVVALFQDDDSRSFPPSVPNLAPFPVQEGRGERVAVSGLSVNTKNRPEVVNLYETIYMASEDVLANSDADLDSCDPGTVSKDYIKALLRRTSLSRAMAGLRAEVRLDQEFSRKSQKGALSLAGKGQLSNFPDDTFPCLEDEVKEATAKSNLSIILRGSGERHPFH